MAVSPHLSIIIYNLADASSYAAGNTKAGSNGRQNSHNSLNNKFPSFLLHFLNF
jgi:hypothetical protein